MIHDVIDPAGVLGGESHQVLLVAGKAVLLRAKDLAGLLPPEAPAPAVVLPAARAVLPAAMPAGRLRLRLLKKPGPKPKAGAALAVKPAAVQEKPRKGEVQERAIEILRAHGPLTTAEFAEHLYPDVDRFTRVQRVHGAVQALRERGLVDKRDDPAAGGISKWFLVKGR